MFGADELGNLRFCECLLLDASVGKSCCLCQRGKVDNRDEKSRIRDEYCEVTTANIPFSFVVLGNYARVR